MQKYILDDKYGEHTHLRIRTMEKIFGDKPMQILGPAALFIALQHGLFFSLSPTGERMFLTVPFNTQTLISVATHAALFAGGLILLKKVFPEKF